MPVIQDRAPALLAFILRHHLRLDLARTPDRVFERIQILGHDRPRMRLEIREQRRIRDDAMLDDLGHSRAQFAVRQGPQQSHIHQDPARLVERADAVLAQRMVDPGLPAHARIHLRHNRRRDLQKRDPPHETRRREPGHVAHDPAAQRHQHARAIQPPLEKRPACRLDLREPLMFLARDQRMPHTASPARGDGRLDPVRVQRPHVRVGHQPHRAARAHALEHVRQRAKNTHANMDRVASRAKFHKYRIHRNLSGKEPTHHRWRCSAIMTDNRALKNSGPF